MSKTIVPLYDMTRCDVTLRFFWCWQKDCVESSPEKYRTSKVFDTTLA